jgi:hypothetical protein
MTVLKNTLKAAAVALTIAGTAMSVAPAQAQSFNFSFGNNGVQFGIGNGRPGISCMSDPQVRRDLRADGYREIRFFDRRGRVVQVRAELGRRDYRIAYDTCRGRIIDRDRI